MNLFPSLTSTGSQHADRLPPPPLRADAHAQKRLHVGQRAAVQDRQFQIVQLHNHVVDAHSDQRRQSVLGGRDQHALPHQARGVAHLGHVPRRGGDLEIVEIRPAEYDP